MPLITPAVQRWLDEARSDPEAFWATAAEALPWFKRWDRVFEWNPPTFRWFVGAETNLAFNCLDRHVQAGEGDRLALVYFNERGERASRTYAQLLADVQALAAALRAHGIRKGDRITIYMPPSCESIALMLAAVRIGAIHSVVFAGFGAGALADRIQGSGSTLLFVSDVVVRRGKETPLLPIVKEALASATSTVQRTIVLSRDNAIDVDQALAGSPVPHSSWRQFVAAEDGQSGECVTMEANEPAFILATSGTTARPKLVVHTHGGYAVHIVSMGRWVFGLKPSDVWWSTSDIGWIVGHSYMVYAPLLIGCTTVVYEGALDYPEPADAWRTAIEECGVTGIFTSPTGIRTLRRYGDAPFQSIDYSRLQRIFCAGEVLNAPAWDWMQNTILKGRVPVIDHMWQTETSGPAFGNPYGIELLPIKPGSATIPLAGIDAVVVTVDGRPCAPNEKGIMALRRPFPGLTASLWGEPDRYGRDYWQKVPGVYSTGDAAWMDDDGYVWFGGRADEVIKIAGHRISSIEVETACLEHPAVAECGAIGRPDETRGEVIAAFLVLRQGTIPSDALRTEIRETIRHELGPVAVVGDLYFVKVLPKTLSGKIMRRVLKAVTLDRDPGDITTIDDEGSVDQARDAWRQMKGELHMIERFRAFRVFEDAGNVSGRIVTVTQGELSQGDVVIKAAYSSVNYKDALAGTGSGKIMRKFPLIGGIDVSGTVMSSADSQFAPGDAVLVTGHDLGVAHDGGYSQVVRVPAGWVVRVPDGLTLSDVMAIGTAGFTAALSVVELERNLLTPAHGPVIVTGATGGVGSIAIQILAALGYAVTALTGKEQEAEYLRRLGAHEILSRQTLQMGTKPLEKARWAGAVDTLGGDTLAWLTRSMLYGGPIAATGLASGHDLKTTVMPFILRGAKLLGIDSVNCAMPIRLDVWRRLATDMKPASLSAMTTEITLDGLPGAFETLMKGQARGRFVVALN